MKLFPGKKPTNKPSVKFEKMCSVYLSRSSKEAIIVSTYYFSGAHVEKDDAISLFFDDPNKLGPIIESEFFKSEYLEEDDYPSDEKNKKKSDWGAYRVSKARSMKQFEKDYVRYSLRGANEANIIIVATSQILPNDIQLTTGFSAPSCGPIAGQRMIDFHHFFLKVESLFD